MCNIRKIILALMLVTGCVPLPRGSEVIDADLQLLIGKKIVAISGPKTPVTITLEDNSRIVIANGWADVLKPKQAEVE